MPSTELFTICVSAFLAVFTLLAILAIVMRLILVIFPAKKLVSDAAVVAALTTVMHGLYPGTKVTKVEEIK